MDYRSRANAWLSTKAHRSPAQPHHFMADGVPSTGLLEGVRENPIADKVQGRREFIRNWRGRHDHIDELDLYFELWLEALGLDPQEYDGLRASIDVARSMCVGRADGGTVCSIRLLG